MQIFENYRRSGSIFYLDPNPAGARAVLLLHGLGADGSSWGYQLQALAEAGYRPLAVDIPGFGRSCWSRGRWSIRTVAGLMADWLAGIGIDRVDVAGISMGGTIALCLALDFPQRVHQLTLVSTFACLRPRSRSETVYLLRRFLVSNLQGVDKQAQLVAQRLFPEPNQAFLREELVQRILQSDQKVYKTVMRRLALFDVRSRLKQLNMPTLVVSGQRDSTVPVATQTQLAQGIPGAHHVLMPDCGHALIVEQPERFNRELLGFLNRGG